MVDVEVGTFTACVELVTAVGPVGGVTSDGTGMLLITIGPVTVTGDEILLEASTATIWKYQVPFGIEVTALVLEVSTIASGTVVELLSHTYEYPERRVSSVDGDQLTSKVLPSVVVETV
jgi:hypothetical protein